MNLLNTPARYGIVSQSLHWVTALLVVVLILSGKAGDIDAEDGNVLYFWHSSLGLLIFLLVVARIIWRFITPPPKKLATGSRLMGRVAAGLHLIFYVLLVALPLSGWLASSAEGGLVSLFGFGTLPRWSVGAGGELFEEAHEVLGNILLILVVLHGLAALKHHFVDKDDVLLRMLPASRR